MCLKKIFDGKGNEHSLDSDKIGNLEELSTDAKDSLVDAVNELDYKSPKSFTFPSSRYFHGDIFSATYVDFDGMQLVCASTDSLTENDLIGKTITVVSDGVETTYTLTADDLNDRGAEDEWHKYIEIKPMTVNDKPIAICAYDYSSDDGGETAISPGVYYLYVADSFYTKVMNYLPEPEETDEVIATLHPKYLPIRRQYGVYPLKYTVDKNNRVAWSASIREVDAAYKKGYQIQGTSPDGYSFYPIYSDPGHLYIFLEIGCNGIPNFLYLV